MTQSVSKELVSILLVQKRHPPNTGMSNSFTTEDQIEHCIQSRESLKKKKRCRFILLLLHIVEFVQQNKTLFKKNLKLSTRKFKNRNRKNLKKYLLCKRHQF